MQGFATSLPVLHLDPDLSIAQAREFVLDEIGAHIAADPGVASRFWDEVGSTQATDAGIAVLYCFLRVGSATFGLLEFVSGQTIEQLCSESDPSSCEQAIPLICRLLDACDAAAVENASGVRRPPNGSENRRDSLRLTDFGIAQASGVAPAPGKLYGTVMVRSDGSWSEEILSEGGGRSGAYPVLTAVYSELLGRLPEATSLAPAQISCFSNRSLIIPEKTGIARRTLPYLTAVGAGALMILSLFGLAQVLAKGVESRQIAGLPLPPALVAKPAPPVSNPPGETPAPASAPEIQTQVFNDGPTREQRLMYQISPEYPAQAREQRVSGLVKLEITIAETGFVRSSKVLSGNPVLARSAVEAVKRWVYQPALVNGKPFSITTEVEFKFDLDRSPMQSPDTKAERTDPESAKVIRGL
jgi:TonB family protein